MIQGLHLTFKMGLLCFNFEAAMNDERSQTHIHVNDAFLWLLFVCMSVCLLEHSYFYLTINLVVLNNAMYFDGQHFITTTST